MEALSRTTAVDCVVTTPDKPRGRNLHTKPSSLKEWANANGVRVLDYSKEEPLLLLPTLKEVRPDLLVVISFGALLRSELLAVPRLYSLNVHASLLPKYRGAAPIQFALLNGDAQTGVSVMRIIERLDAGDIFLQKETPIGPEENRLELEKRLSTLAGSVIVEAIDTIERGNAKWTVQEDTKATYTRKISKSDGKINWQCEAAEIGRQVRAFLGWPGTFTFFGGKRLLVLKAQVAAGKEGPKPGTVIESSEDRGLLIAAGANTALGVMELQLEGKKAMPWKEFRKGFALPSGAVFE